MRFKYLISILLISIFIFSSVVNVCAEAEEEPIIVGSVINMTTDFALYGEQQMAAVEMAVDKVNESGGINGRQIQLEKGDAAASPPDAVNALNRVLQSEPVAVFGPIIGGQMLAMLEVLLEENIDVPLLTISGTRGVTQQGYDAVFRFMNHDGISKVAWTDYVVNEFDAEDIGILVVANEWGYSARDITKNTLEEKYNIEPKIIETYQFSDRDMTAQLLNLKKADVDIIMQQGHPADTAVILQQRRQFGINIPIICSNTVQTAASLDITVPEDFVNVYAEGYLHPNETKDEKILTWAENFEEEYGFVPDQYAFLQYEMAMMLFDIMGKYGTERESIIEGLSTEEYEGIFYTFKRDAEGNMMNVATIIEYDGKNGEIIQRLNVPIDEQR